MESYAVVLVMRLCEYFTDSHNLHKRKLHVIPALRYDHVYAHLAPGPFPVISTRVNTAAALVTRQLDYQYESPTLLSAAFVATNSATDWYINIHIFVTTLWEATSARKVL